MTASKRKSGFPAQKQARQPGKEHEMSPPPEFIRRGYVGCLRLEGKHCLISGADSGIGRAVAVHFAAEGAATIGIAYLSETEDAEATRAIAVSIARQAFFSASARRR